MQTVVSTENTMRSTQIVAVKFGEVEPYCIQFGVWRRLKQTLIRAILSIAGNDRVLSHQQDTTAMNCVETGGKQSCQVIIL
jgi:hypothetical protein